MDMASAASATVLTLHSNCFNGLKQLGLQTPAWSDLRWIWSALHADRMTLQHAVQQVASEQHSSSEIDAC